MNTQRLWKKFRHWVNKPCPSGEWVYRGQAQKYLTVLPGMLRCGNEVFFESRNLFHIDQNIAEEIFNSSPAFVNRPLFAEIISDQVGKKLEAFAYNVLGGPPSAHSQLSFPEIIRSLAQHYDFPTLFIDVSFHPLVAAFFATHSCQKGRWVASKEPGVVLRWPASRLSSSRLEIRGTSKGEASRIGVIDITEIHSLIRRPRHQFAGLATPVSDPKPIYQPFSSPLDQHKLCDMATLDCCERFELPFEAGATLEKLEGLTADTLFPDCIDLGYSYVSVIAYLSLVTHKASGIKDMPTGWIDAGNASYQRAILAGRALLDRECLRLLPGAPVTDLIYQYPLKEIDMNFGDQLESARKAVERMKSEEVASLHQKFLANKENQTNEKVQLLYSIYLKTLAEVSPEAAASLSEQSPPQVVVRPGNTDWILREMDRRVSLINAIIGWADCVPAFELAKSKRYERYLDTMVRDSDYERQVRRAIKSCRGWLHETQIFVGL